MCFECLEIRHTTKIKFFTSPFNRALFFSSRRALIINDINSSRINNTKSHTVYPSHERISICIRARLPVSHRREREREIANVDLIWSQQHSQHRDCKKRPKALVHILLDLHDSYTCDVCSTVVCSKGEWKWFARVWNLVDGDGMLPHVCSCCFCFSSRDSSQGWHAVDEKENFIFYTLNLGSVWHWNIIKPTNSKHTSQATAALELNPSQR